MDTDSFGRSVSFLPGLNIACDSSTGRYVSICSSGCIYTSSNSGEIFTLYSFPYNVKSRQSLLPCLLSFAGTFARLMVPFGKNLLRYQLCHGRKKSNPPDEILDSARQFFAVVLIVAW